MDCPMPTIAPNEVRSWGRLSSPARRTEWGKKQKKKATEPLFVGCYSISEIATEKRSPIAIIHANRNMAGPSRRNCLRLPPLISGSSGLSSAEKKEAEVISTSVRFPGGL